MENGQEALDSILLGYKVSENSDVLLPSMVCLDGFILTHTVDPVDVPSQGDVDKFLPPYKPVNFLDPENPASIGSFTDPEYYMEARYAMQEAMEKSKKVIAEANKEFAELFGREYGFVEKYKCEDADTILVAMGSICSTIKEVVDDLRETGEKVGLLRVRVFRPFPEEEIYDALKGASKVGVIDKNISFGVGGVLYNNIKAKMCDIDSYGFILGLGGRDITPSTIKEVVEKTKNPTKDVQWIGLKEEEL